MSFLDGGPHVTLLDCPDQETGMKTVAWGGADLLDPGGDASDFDISSFFNQLTSSAAPVEAPHVTEELCASGVSADQLAAAAPADGDQLCAATEEAGAADVSLSALLGEHAELQEALLAASEPPPAPCKTFVVVKKKQQQPEAEQTEQRPGQGRRRRATPPYGPPPTAPLSAYNLFVKEQYPKMKAKWQACNVRRAVPKLAKLWARMTPKEKDVYHGRAEAEKQRYRALLHDYRQRARLWRQHQAEAAKEDGLPSPAPEVHSDDDRADLYCSLCHLYFSNSHNKEKHLLSKRHVRSMARRAADQEETLCGADGSCPAPPEESSAGAAEETAAADVPATLESVLLAVSRREQEIRFLTEFSADLTRQRQELQQQLTEMEARRAAAAVDQETVTSQHRQLSEQVQNLLLVPTLFGVMSQWSRDAQRASSAISQRRAPLEL